jgi:hypothetical protein
MHDISSGSTAEDIDRRLWLELTPEQYGLVRELIRLEADAPIVGLLDESVYEDGAAPRACCERRQREEGSEPTP